MGSNRIHLEEEQAATRPMPGFMAVPAMLLGVMDASTVQRQLYQWAYEQAQQAVQARRPAPMRDLFAIMN